MTEVWFTIAGMAVATYLTRLGGVWAISRVELTPRIERWLNQLPATILIAIVAPLLVQGNPPEWLAALIVIVMAVKTGNLLITVIAGAGAVVIARNFLIF